MKEEPAAYIDDAYALFKATEPTSGLVKRVNAPWEDQDWFFEDPHKLFYLFQMSIGIGPKFDEAVAYFIRERQTVRGFLASNHLSHVGPMRVLINIDPLGHQTELAISYYLEHLDRFEDADEMSVGLLALSEADSVKYESTMALLAKKIKGFLARPSKVEVPKGRDLKAIAMSIQALARIGSLSDPTVKRAVKHLKENQADDGSWEGYWRTAQALLALVAIGEGPRVPKERLENMQSSARHLLAAAKPRVVSTNPVSSDFSLRDWVRANLPRSGSRLWICSRFVTEFWTDLISLKRDKPSLDLRVATIPKREAKQSYSGSGKKFLDPAADALQRALEGNYREGPLMHARAIITDDAVLVSSADLSGEQLEKEFNLGIWTRDPDAVREAALAFQTYWEALRPIAETDGKASEL